MKYEGLEVVERDSAKGSAEYLYKGVRVSKYGGKFVFKVNHFRASAIVPTNYSKAKYSSLKEVIANIDSWLIMENVGVEGKEIINGLSDRQTLRDQGKWKA